MNPLKASRTVVVLVRPEFSEGIYGATFGKQMRVGTKRVEPPMALMQLAGALIEAGHEARIVDGEVENLTVDETVDRICQARPDVVGVTATTPENIAAAQVLRAVKRRLPGVVAVIGGAHATHVPWELADADDAFDYVVVFEGEKAMVAIADGDRERLRDYSDNAQRLLRRVGLPDAERYADRVLLGDYQTEEDLDRVRALRDAPWIDMRKYRGAEPELGLVVADSVETARGCPFGCSFCSSARSGLRMRNVDNVLDELETIDHRFRRQGMRGMVLFLDDTLTIHRARATELFEGIIRRGIDIRFRGFTRAPSITTRNGRAADIEFVRLMRRAGSTAISLGIETGSEQLNKDMNKGSTLDHYRRAYDILDAADFEERRGSFIIGNPNETLGTIRESIDFAKELGLHRVGVNIMTPYPGTDAYNRARTGQGLYFEPQASDYSQYRRWGHSVVSTDALSAEALEYWHQRFLTEVYMTAGAVRHAVTEFRGGNRSRFYFRPVFQAHRQYKQMLREGTWDHPLRFPPPNHTGYDPEAWGRQHVTKTDCLTTLNEKSVAPSSPQLIQV